MNIQELQVNILAWAEAKGLIKKENTGKQYLKFLEEVGETARAILKNDVKEIKDGFGDIAVTLFILSAQLGQLQELESIEKNTRESDFSRLMSRVSPNSVSYFSIGHLQDACNYYGYDLTECVNLAWEEIKDRTGKTVDGVFVKNA